MLSVNTDRPLFWFLGGPDVTSMKDLRGRRLAVHAPDNPPGCFARIVLRKHDLAYNLLRIAKLSDSEAAA